MTANATPPKPQIYRCSPIACLFLINAYLFAGTAFAAGPEIVTLSRNWAVRSTADVKETGDVVSTLRFQPAHWYPATIPSTVLGALVEDKLYPDPFYGLNLKSIPGYRAGRWLVMPENSPFKKPWWYRTVFTLPGSCRGKTLTLHLDGINYRANVWLNGRRVADSRAVVGMFRRFEFSISRYANPGADNCLAVEIIPPGLLPDIPYRSKQVEATAGWDDHNPQPPDANMGIWQNVYITVTGPVIVKNPYVSTKLDLPSLKMAHLTVSAYVVNAEDREVAGELKGEIGSIAFAQSVKLAPGEKRLVAFSPAQFRQLNIQNPRLWWPNPVGPQEMYELRVSFVPQAGEVSDAKRVRFGIREATTYINEEGWRGYRINGRNILIRGGAWMTTDMLLRFSPRRYEALIRYAREANLNMLRSEGFSIRETDEFYGLCDKYGVMVTQQIFGRSIPDEALAISCIEDTLLRIRNHPSLVHFLGHDETYPTPALDRAYRALIAKYTPERTYQPHSGAFDVKERFKTGGTRTGTRELWTYATPDKYYKGKEDGAWGFAQSGGIGGVIAPLDSMRRMMPEKDLWPPWTEAWSFHTVIQGGRYFDALLEALDARYGKASGIADFCMKGQIMNYESARGMYEAFGRNKYSALGITAWKYDAAWPASPTWQFVDWYLRAGGAYYGAKKACEALHVQYSYDDNSIYVINGMYRDYKGLRVSARIFDFGLRERFTRQATVDVPADGKTKAFPVEPPKDMTKTYFLSLKLADASGKPVSDNFYWLSTVPDISGPQSERGDTFISRPASTADFTALSSLPKVSLRPEYRFERRGSESIGRVRVTNTTGRLAFFVHLAALKGKGGEEVLPSYWEDNYFSLLPGESKEVQVRLTTDDLGGAAPSVGVDGVNITM